VPVAEVCPKHGASGQTDYVRRRKYGGLAPLWLARLRVLEAENKKLKALVADLSLDKHMLQEVIEKNSIRPGKPVENAFIESFNGRLRDECLNTHGFLSLDHAKEGTEAWRKDHNELRPHSAWGNLTPREHAARIRRE